MAVIAPQQPVPTSVLRGGLLFLFLLLLLKLNFRKSVYICGAVEA